MKIKLVNITPEMIRQARDTSGLTQPEAAELVKLSAFQRWSEHERGVTPIDPARWELFLLLTGQHPNYHPLRAKT
jgi:DNA-binding transcriptional regulator YiaG